MKRMLDFISQKLKSEQHEIVKSDSLDKLSSFSIFSEEFKRTLMDVKTSVLKLIARANPKSHSLTTPSLPRRMFCGFMSRCRMRLECK
jgi:hypothetical protein